jgi:large subunit ribosomal protein L4
MNAKVFNQDGKEIKTVELPKEIFELPWNADLVHQVVYSMMTDARDPIAHTKNRGDVRGGGRKPWRQKGTGRARHGSRRSPIWVGGGVAHGPRNEKDYSRKINRKMKNKALAVILSEKARKGNLILIDSMEIKEPKTKMAKEIILSLSKNADCKDLATKRKNSAVIAISARNQNISKSFSNMGNFLLDEVKNINPVDIMNYKYVIIAKPEESFKVLSDRLIK